LFETERTKITVFIYMHRYYKYVLHASFLLFNIRLNYLSHVVEEGKIK
jgi:hypothetical protein